MILVSPRGSDVTQSVEQMVPEEIRWEFLQCDEESWRDLVLDVDISNPALRLRKG